MENTFRTSGGLSHSTEPMHQDWATTAYWANFLAIVNYVLLGLGAVALLFFSAFIRQLPGAQEDMDNPLSYYMLAGGGAIGIVIGFVFLGLAFVITTFLFRFARRLKSALASQDQEAFVVAWLQFRNYFRWNGIFTIAFLVAYLVMIIAMASALTGLRNF
jgi:hypothetical protein